MELNELQVIMKRDARVVGVLGIVVIAAIWCVYRYRPAPVNQVNQLVSEVGRQAQVQNQIAQQLTVKRDVAAMLGNIDANANGVNELKKVVLALDRVSTNAPAEEAEVDEESADN